MSMKAFWRAAALIFVFVLAFAPSFSLSAYQWESCTDEAAGKTTGTCTSRNVGKTEVQFCHKNPVNDLFEWGDEPVVKGRIESPLTGSSACSDGYDNNCNGLIDRVSGKVETNDCLPPSITITSVAGDTAATYYDKVNDEKTDIVVSGETWMSCRWYDASSDFDALTGTKCDPYPTGLATSATCSVDNAITEGAKTRYVACKDWEQNKQAVADAVTSYRPKKIDWINDWTGPVITFNEPPDPTGVPYDIDISLSDANSGVDKTTIMVEASNNGGAYNDITASISVTGTCENAGEVCALTRTIISGNAEATDGTHTLRVTAKDVLGNNQQAPNTYTYTVSTCKLDSVSIAPAAACNKQLNSCTVTGGTACKGSDGVTVTAAYTGLGCPASFTVRVDAKSADDLCNVQGSGGQMTGVSITCSNPTPSGSQQTCTGTWTLPALVPSACQGKAITAKTGASDGCIDGNHCTTPSGSFGSCKDNTQPPVSVILESGNDYIASKTVTATSLSGKDDTYGLNSCTLGWGHGSPTTKTCDGTVGEECASKFSAADKQHTYPTDSSAVGDKIATFSCTNKNSIPGSSSDEVTICTSINDVTNLKAYSSPSKTTQLGQNVWQNNNKPYIEWDPVTSLCGVKYEVNVENEIGNCLNVINNGNSGIKADIVFVGDGYRDDSALRSDVLKLVDYDGNNLYDGLMSVEPFKANRNKFNIWMVKAGNSIQRVGGTNPEFVDAPSREDSLKVAAKCSMADYKVIMSNGIFRSHAYFDGDAYLSLGEQVDDRINYIGGPDGAGEGRLLVHEFGHSFAQLRDEYSEEGRSDSPGSPNCAPDQATAQIWWGDLVAAGAANIGYYPGCSYVDDNIRPTSNSIMKDHWILAYTFYAVNERHIKSILDKYL